jgi:hypothetical protein
MATISRFGSAASLTDNTSAAGPTVTVTPPASMTSGMLVSVTVWVRNTFPLSWDDITVAVTGGQEWMEITDDSFTGNAIGMGKRFVCIFNGTWSANPQFTSAVTTTVTAIMVVYQHDAGSAKRFVVQSPHYPTAQAAATTQTNPSFTIPTQPAVIEAAWGVQAANTWGSLTAGWTNALATAQVRNTAGSAMSVAHAYKVFTATGASGTVSETQSASTAGCSSLIAFALEDVNASNPPTKPTVDFYLDGEQGSDAATLTLANLQAMTRASAVGSWATQGGTPTQTFIAAAGEKNLSPNAVVVNGVTRDDTGGTRGIRYNHPTGTLTPSWAYSFPATKTIVSIGFWFQTTYQLAQDQSYSSVAMFCGGGEFTVFNIFSQHTSEHSARLETNDATGSVLGPRISNSTWYWVTMKIDTVAGVSWMSLWTWNGSAWVQKGLTCGMPTVTGTPVDTLQVFCTGGSYAAVTGSSYYDNLVMDWTTATFPLLPGQPPTPTITQDPNNAWAFIGGSAGFSVGALASAGSLHYQWKVNGVSVGTDSAFYLFQGAVATDNGASVTCDVTDDNGTVTSDPGYLTVVPPPGRHSFLQQRL